MSIKTILFLCTISCSFLTAANAQEQNKANKWPPDKFPHNPRNCFHLLSNSFQCNWIVYGIKGSIEGTVIAYNSLPPAAKGPATASVSILKAGDDTIRVLHLNGANHKPGDHIRVIAAREPELDVLAPFDRDFSINEEKKGNNPACRINEYDHRIYKTAWGTIAEQPSKAPQKTPAKAPVKKPAPKKA